MQLLYLIYINYIQYFYSIISTPTYNISMLVFNLNQ